MFLHVPKLGERHQTCGAYSIAESLSITLPDFFFQLSLHGDHVETSVKGLAILPLMGPVSNTAC